MSEENYALLYHHLNDAMIDNLTSGTEFKIVLHLIKVFHYNNYSKTTKVFKASEFVDRFNVSKVSISKALNSLADKGFIESKHLGAEGQRITLLTIKKSYQLTKVNSKEKFIDKEKLTDKKSLHNNKEKFIDTIKKSLHNDKEKFIVSQPQTTTNSESTESLNKALSNTLNNTKSNIYIEENIYNEIEAINNLSDFQIGNSDIQASIKKHKPQKVYDLVLKYPEIYKRCDNDYEYAIKFLRKLMKGDCEFYAKRDEAVTDEEHKKLIEDIQVLENKFIGYKNDYEMMPTRCKYDSFEYLGKFLNEKAEVPDIKESKKIQLKGYLKLLKMIDRGYSFDASINTMHKCNFKRNKGFMINNFAESYTALIGYEFEITK